MSPSEPRHPSAAGGQRFATTRWSVVLAAGRDPSPASRAALAALCETYWRPLYGFARRSGHPPADAQDLTQGFFARLLEKEDLAGARPERGPFRSFLLASLKHFMANEWDKARAQKRGGGRAVLSLDFADAEDLIGGPASREQTPQTEFEKQWALTLLDQVHRALRGEYAAAGKEELFDHLQPYLTRENAAGYAETAQQLNMTAGALKVAVHRMRRRFGERLREEIGETVETDEDVEDEIRDLFEALRRNA